MAKRTRKPTATPATPEPAAQPGLEFKPTADQRATVKAMAGYGIPQDEICMVVVNPESGEPIDGKTLRKHFRRELDTGMVEANAKVGESLYLQAVGAPAVYDDKGRQVRSEQPRVPSAGIFWAKARMGWREKLDLNVVQQYDLSRLSEAELDVFEQLASKAAIAGRNSGRASETSH